jgi:hypothetical protein
MKVKSLVKRTLFLFKKSSGFTKMNKSTTSDPTGTTTSSATSTSGLISV